MTSGKTFYGWYVVAACAVGLACGLPSVITATFPIFLAPLRAEFSWTQTEAFAALFVTTLTVTIAAPFFGALVDRIGAKRMIIAGLVLEALHHFRHSDLAIHPGSTPHSSIVKPAYYKDSSIICANIISEHSFCVKEKPIECL